MDTKSTNKALRDVIKDLPSYALTVDGDIDKIHQRFNEYHADAEFRRYMAMKKDAYYENVNDMANTNWTSPEEEQVIALKAEINKINDKNLRLSKALQEKLDKPAPTTSSTTQGGTSNSNSGSCNPRQG